MKARSVCKLFLPVLLALSALTGSAFSSRAESQAVRKVIRFYALTSGNDFQQRDPQDWRLLASNDGKNWTTLDWRTGEFFTERHQRRIFRIANTNDFNIYRLNIDRVRNVSGNSVQLAELEVMGESATDTSPEPIFADRITRRGDNPPLESVAQLFDGKPETKWLDRPTDQRNCSSWIQWQYVSLAGLSVTNIQQLHSLRSRADAGCDVRLDAYVTDRRSGSGTIEVLDDTGALEVNDVPAGTTFSPGQHVRIEGVSQWSSNRCSVRLSRIETLSSNAAAGPLAIPLEKVLGGQDDFIWGEVFGTVRFLRRSDEEVLFDVQDENHAMRVRVRRSDLPADCADDRRVRVRGICCAGFNARGERVAISIWASHVEVLSEANREAPNADLALQRHSHADSSFTTIQKVNSMGRDELARRPVVKIRGVITSLLGMYLQDETGGIQVALEPGMSRMITQLGDYVELQGHGGLSDASTPVVSVDRVFFVGNGKPPVPTRPTWGQLVSGGVDSQWIEMDGVVRATDGAHLLLNCDGRQVIASINAGTVAVVKQLVDAAVRVRGVGLAALDDWGRVQGVHLLIPSLDYIEVQRPPTQPFSQPVQPIGNILKLNRPEESLHRVRIEGVLTLQDGRRLYLQDNTGCAMAIFKEDVVLDPRFGRSRWSFWRAPAANTPLPADMKFLPGDRIQVVGFRDAHGYSPVLTEVSVQKVGIGTIMPQTINSNSAENVRLDCALVTFEAVLMRREISGSRAVLELLWNGRTLQAYVPSDEKGLNKIENGTQLKVTGVWQMEPVPYAELGQRIASVRVLLRSVDDLVVLARPSWWTLQRALIVIGGMAFVLLAASIWITQLHRKVEERSVQLSAEIHRREQIERQRALEEERARIAQDLHDDLGAALTQIRFLSAVESRDEAVPEGTRSRLRQVTEKSRHLVASLDEIVWAINPANDSLPKLVNYLSHVAEEFFNSTPIRCRLDVDETFPEVSLTSEVRHNLYLATRESLNNIAKHSQATEVWLRFKWNEGALQISIEDNGRGFIEPVEAQGEGLLNMRRRMEKIGGRFEFLSTPGTGTVTRIWLSLK